MSNQVPRLRAPQLRWRARRASFQSVRLHAARSRTVPNQVFSYTPRGLEPCRIKLGSCKPRGFEECRIKLCDRVASLERPDPHRFNLSNCTQDVLRTMANQARRLHATRIRWRRRVSFQLMRPHATRIRTVPNQLVRPSAPLRATRIRTVPNQLVRLRATRIRTVPNQVRDCAPRELRTVPNQVSSCRPRWRARRVSFLGRAALLASVGKAVFLLGLPRWATRH